MKLKSHRSNRAYVAAVPVIAAGARRDTPFYPRRSDCWSHVTPMPIAARGESRDYQQHLPVIRGFSLEDSSKPAPKLL